MADKPKVPFMIIIVAIIAVFAVICIGFIARSNAGAKAGDVIILDVTVENVNDLAGIQLDVAHSANLVFDRMDAGQLIAGQTINAGPSAVSPEAVRNVAIARLNGGVSGSGVAATVYFTVSDKGPVTFEAQNIILASSQGEKLPSESVRIVQRK